MTDATTTLTTAPGNGTSEYQLTKWAIGIGTALDVVVAPALAGLSQYMPGAHWLAVATAVSGALLSICALYGYQRSRTGVKMAVAAASQPTQPQDLGGNGK